MCKAASAVTAMGYRDAYERGEDCCVCRAPATLPPPIAGRVRAARFSQRVCTIKG